MLTRFICVPVVYYNKFKFTVKSINNFYYQIKMQSGRQPQRKRRRICEGLKQDEDEEELTPKEYELFVEELDKLRDEKIPTKRAKMLMDHTRRLRGGSGMNVHRLGMFCMIFLN